MTGFIYTPLQARVLHTRYLSRVHADFLTVARDTPTDIGRLTSVGTNNIHMQNAAETIESMENIIHTNQAPCLNTPITVTTTAFC